MVEILLTISLFIILHSYVVYPLILMGMKKSSFGKNETETPITISVLIAAYNEEKVIRQRIENLLQCDFPKEQLEILIGSDCSSDSTNAIVSEYKDAGVRLLPFRVRRGKGAVLNDLCSEAAHEILVFSDANTYYSSDVLTNMARHYQSPSIGGVCGYLQLIADDKNTGGKSESAYWELENRIKQLEGDIFTTFGATGAIYSIRRSLYVRIPDGEIVTDDLYLPLKAVEKGGRIIYDAAVKGWEHATESARTEYHRKVRISASNFNTLRHLNTFLDIRNGFLAFGFISHKLFRWLVPFCLIVVFICSMFLREDYALIDVLFVGQLLFYGLGFGGYILDALGKPMKLFSLPYYFILANLGLLVGFFRYVNGSQQPTWSATR